MDDFRHAVALEVPDVGGDWLGIALYDTLDREREHEEDEEYPDYL
jgi:hypothetical protein